MASHKKVFNYVFNWLSMCTQNNRSSHVITLNTLHELEIMPYFSEIVSSNVTRTVRPPENSDDSLTSPKRDSPIILQRTASSASKPLSYKSPRVRYALFKLFTNVKNA